ncbi:MAG: urea transporter [Heteroscytonema crispum UTEX LB 1556]
MHISDQFVAVTLVVLAIFICTLIGAGVGLLACGMYVIAGLLLHLRPEQLYDGFWRYNAALTAIALGGTFYTPNCLSIG